VKKRAMCDAFGRPEFTTIYKKKPSFSGTLHPIA
jgi:hypothetical protein